MASTLDELYTKSPGTQQVASTPNAESSNATAGTATAGTANASTYTAQTQDVPKENLTSSRLNDITSQDSPLMQRARQEGMLLAARRGLLNSSIAAGTAQGAVVDRAAPIAGQEADILQGQRLANQNATNTAQQFNAANTTDVSKTNAGLLTDASKLNAQLGTQTSMQNAQNATETSRFNAETAAQKAQQDAQAENAMRTAVMNQNAELNKQYLSGQQAQDLATIQAQYQALIQSNASAANLYNTYFQTISQVMSNPNIDPARIAQIVGTLQQSLVGGMDFLNAMSGIAPTSGTGAPVPAPGSPGTTSQLPIMNAPSSSGTNVRLPTPVNGGSQAFNAAGGEAATTGYLSNARNVLAADFAQQQAAPSAPSGAQSTPAVQPPPTVPPGTEASVYGGLLSGAGALASGIGKDGSLLDAAGKVASGVGGAANVVGGVQQGGVEGYSQAAQGALQVAGSLGVAGAGEVAPYIGIASDAAKGNYTGAAAGLVDLAAGGPIAAISMAAAALANKAFFSDGSKDRNVAAYKAASKSTTVAIQQGHFGFNYVVMPKGDGTYMLVSGQDFNDLAGSWYGAVFHPDGNADDWKAKYMNYVQNLQSPSLPKGYSFDSATGKIMYRGQVAGNYSS